MIKLDGYTFVDLGPDGGPFDDTAHPKLEWHTMETYNVGAAENAYRNYPPHLGVNPLTNVKRQYVSLDRHAFANSGYEADDEFMIQVEVAGFAKDARSWSDDVYRWLAENVVLPLERAIGVPRRVIYKGFKDYADYKPANPTNYLASSRSEQRITLDELRSFSGHIAHQNMPAPDSHWDAGAFQIGKVFHFAALHDNEENEMPAPKSYTAAARSGAGVLKLQADGGIVSSGSPRFFGSIFRLPPEKRQLSVGEFFASIVVMGDPANPTHMILITNNGDEYDSRSWGNK